MTSKTLFSDQLQKNFQTAFQIATTLKQKEVRQIISILKQHAALTEIDIAIHLGYPPSFVYHHLNSLHQVKLLLIEEEADQAHFSLDMKRLAKISTLLQRLGQ